MLNLQIDPREVDLIIKEFDATEKDVYAAFKSSLNRTARWLKTRAAREMRESVKVKAALLRRRLKIARVNKTSDGWGVKLWLGLNPISYHELNPKQNAVGVKAGAHQIEHAFIAKGVVFKRKGAARLPIEKQYLEIKNQGEKALESSFVDEWQEVFFKEFARYLEMRARA